MPKLVPHQITIDGKKYVMMAPDVYDNIKDITGIQKCPSPDNTDYAGKKSVRDLLSNGDAVRITCRVVIDAATKKMKDKTVICVAAKFTSAMGALLSKKVGGFDVATTRIPRRQRLG